MKKSAKKKEQAITKALDRVCENLKLKHKGFVWLTHFGDYDNFPQSLKIVLVFENNQYLINAKSHALFSTVFQLSESLLKQEGIHIKRIDKTVFFDTEENGADYNDPSWCRKYD